MSEPFTLTDEEILALRTLKSAFEGFAALVLSQSASDARREYLALASQGGRLAKKVGVDRSILWWPRRTAQGFESASVTIDPDSLSPTVGDTGQPTAELMARGWESVVDAGVRAEPTRFPDPLAEWEVESGAARRTWHPDDDPRPSLRLAAMRGGIAAGMLADRLEKVRMKQNPGQRKRRRPARSKADEVRRLLADESLPPMTQTDLATKVGYTQPSALRRVKGFEVLWARYQKRIAQSASPTAIAFSARRANSR